MQQRRSNERGTSFMDVLVGIAISGVTLGIAMSTMPSLMQPYRLSSATRILTAEFRVARMKAIAQNRRYRINFNDDGGTYRIEEEASANNWQVTTGSGVQTLPDGISFSEINTTPTFNAQGMLNQAFSVDVSSGDKTRTVSVNLLGNVSIS